MTRPSGMEPEGPFDPEGSDEPHHNSPHTGTDRGARTVEPTFGEARHRARRRPRIQSAVPALPHPEQRSTNHTASRGRATGPDDAGSDVHRHGGDAVGAPGPPSVPLPTVERLVVDLFRVELTLAGCASIVDDAVAIRLHGAIDELARIIRDVRVEFVRRETPPVTAPPDGSIQPSSSELSELVAQLRQTAHQLDQLAAGDAITGERAFDLIEASFRSHGAAAAIERARTAGCAAEGRPPLDDCGDWFR